MIRLISKQDGKEFPLKWWTFPGGERNVKIDFSKRGFRADEQLDIICKFTSSDDLIDLLLLVNAIRNGGNMGKLDLTIPYFPFARQDRVMNPGEPFALQVVANLIKSCNFNTVTVWDPHSDVLAGMFDPGVLQVKHQADLAKEQIMYNPEVIKGTCALISPDAGALKKIYKLAKIVNMPVIEASKTRDISTGDIVSVSINSIAVTSYDTLIVVDDICDGGRTFIELGKEIRKRFCGKLILIVTHGIFSRGIEVFDGIYDTVLYSNDMRNI